MSTHLLSFAQTQLKTNDKYCVIQSKNKLKNQQIYKNILATKMLTGTNECTVPPKKITVIYHKQEDKLKKRRIPRSVWEQVML